MSLLRRTLLPLALLAGAGLLGAAAAGEQEKVVVRKVPAADASSLSARVIVKYRNNASVLSTGRATALSADTASHASALAGPQLASAMGARLGVTLFDLLFVIDVQIGTVGYLLTMRPFDAQIRSGNPFLAGWLAALMCYPPFVYGIISNDGVIGYEYNTADWAYWLQWHPALMWVWGGGLALLTALYAWATVAFGIRFSNLTYRGVLTNGPYRFSRHPAYLAKNLFWWGSTLPFFVTSGSLVDSIRNTFFLGCVSAIYYWRARTEERHLRADPAYQEYDAWMTRNAPIPRFFQRVFGTKR